MYKLILQDEAVSGKATADSYVCGRFAVDLVDKPLEIVERGIRPNA